MFVLAQEVELLCLNHLIIVIAVDEVADIHIISMQMYLIYFVQMFLSRDKMDAGEQ